MSSDRKFTPGPIFVDVRSGVAVLSTKPTPNCLSEKCDGEILRISGDAEQEGFAYKVISETQRANMRLWGTASELYEALQVAGKFIAANHSSCTDLNDMILAALSKAEGKGDEHGQI